MSEKIPVRDMATATLFARLSRIKPVARFFAPGEPRPWYVAGTMASSVDWLEFPGEPESGRRPPKYTHGVALRISKNDWFERANGTNFTAVAYALGEAVMVTPNVLTTEELGVLSAEPEKVPPDIDLIAGIGQGSLRMQVGKFDIYEGYEPRFPRFTPLPGLAKVVAGPTPMDELVAPLPHAHRI